MGRKKGSKNKVVAPAAPVAPIASKVSESVVTPIDSTVPKPGDTIKVVDQSEAYNRTETVQGVHEGKKAKFSEPS